MYAIVDIDGAQHLVKEGQKVVVRLAGAEAGKAVSFSRVLLASTDAGLRTGTPLVAGASVEARVVRPVAGPKVTIYKFKRRTNYRRKRGFRATLAELEITRIKV